MPILIRCNRTAQKIPAPIVPDITIINTELIFVFRKIIKVAAAIITERRSTLPIAVRSEVPKNAINISNSPADAISPLTVGRIP